MKTAIFSIDFDGTCVTNEFPKVGKNIGAQYVLQYLLQNGSKIILFTVRGNGQVSFTGEPLETNVLQDAIVWFVDNHIELYGINKNPAQTWSDSNKPYADIIIDDNALGVPLNNRYSKPFVDWSGISMMLHGS